MKIQLFLMADYANVSDDGKLNVMGIFRGLGSTGFPVKHPSMYLVLSLIAELGESGQSRDIAIKLLDADGGEMFAVNGQIEVPDNTGLGMAETNTIIQLRDVVFPKPGRYMFVVILDKDHKGHLSLEVSQVQEP